VLIIGAGSAGSVVANRISADPSRSVAVLEAGLGLSDPVLRAETANGLRLPIGAASPLVQRYQTRLTDHPAREMGIMRGATVGGSGAVNGGYFCRGLRRDFDGFPMSPTTSAQSRPTWTSPGRRTVTRDRS
jgi:choline dehydrogenase